jgi:hypothetical protein
MTAGGHAAVSIRHPPAPSPLSNQAASRASLLAAPRHLPLSLSSDIRTAPALAFSKP